MNNRMQFAAALFLALAFCLGPMAGIAGQPLVSRQFADSDGRLDSYSAAMFFLFRADSRMAVLLEPRSRSIDSLKLTGMMADSLAFLQMRVGHGAPWSSDEIDRNAASGSGGGAGQVASGSGIGAVLQRFQLRSSVNELGYQEGRSRDRVLAGVKGATISFSDNRLKSNGVAWSSQGALGYSVGQISRFPEAVVIPAVRWSVNRSGAGSVNGTTDIEELEFTVPVSCYLYTGSGGSGTSLWVMKLRPWYLTDFSFDDELYGGEISSEYVGNLFGSPLVLGGFQQLSGTLSYQLRLVPKLAYSVTSRGGEHTARKPGDDWLNAGGLASFDLSLSPQVPFAAGVSYEFLQGLAGKATDVHLFGVSGTLWLDTNRRTALKLSYQQGKSLVTAAKVDLVTLGMEIRQ